MQYIDLHCDTISRTIIDQSAFDRNEGHVDLDKLLRGKCLAQVFAIYFPLDQVDDPFESYQLQRDHFKRFLSLSNQMHLITNTQEMKAHGVNALLSVEEGGVLAAQIDRLATLKKDGVSALTLTWNFENEWGYSSHKWFDQAKGLKPFGKEALEVMNALRMIIDVSHLSDRGTEDVLAISKAPVMASHSNARTILNHQRNLPDHLIKGIANQGGVIGINYCPYFITGTNQMTFETTMAHIKHILKVGGEDVLAWGSDFDGMSGDLEVKDASLMPQWIPYFERQGLQASVIEKIMYKNAYRLFKDVLG